MKNDWRDSDHYYRWNRSTYRDATIKYLEGAHLVIFYWRRMDGEFFEQPAWTLGLDGVDA